MKQIILEKNIIKAENPNWLEAKYLTIYKRDLGLKCTKNKSS